MIICFNQNNYSIWNSTTKIYNYQNFSIYQNIKDLGSTFVYTPPPPTKSKEKSNQIKSIDT